MKQPLPLFNVVEESFDEAEFLWRAWELGLHAPARNLRDTWFWTEDRLQGALDGVRLGGQRVIGELLVPGLASHHPPVVQVAAHVLAQLPGVGHEALQAALFTAGANTHELLPRAFELLTTPTQISAANKLFAACGANALPWLVASCTFRRQSTSFETVRELAASPLAPLRRLAMQAARLLPAPKARSLVDEGLRDSDLGVAMAAIESGLVRGMRSSWLRCGQLSTTHPTSGALLWLACLGGAQEQKALMSSLERPDSFAVALQALGFLGTREAADVALETMQAQTETNLRLAAEAFVAITGLDLAAARLVASEPPLPEEPLSFEQDNLQANLVPSPDDLLPLPDVQGIARWWQHNRQHFAVDARYLGGQKLSPHALYDALVRGPMRRRHLWAFELAVRTSGVCDVQTRAFYAFQKQQLAQVRSLLNDQALPFRVGQPAL